MPVILLERIPLPSLRSYTTVSVLILSVAVFYALHTVRSIGDESEELQDQIQIESSFPESKEPQLPDESGRLEDIDENLSWNVTLPYESISWNILFVLVTDFWCIWAVVNMAYCCLILVGKLVQLFVFGELRVSEQQHLRDKFWNFVFYKFIFVFGVMNVQTMEEVIQWAAWFTVIGFLHLFSQLCKDRFEYLSFSPTTPRWTHIKLLSLLFLMILCCNALMAFCIWVGLNTGITIFAFMMAECLLLTIRVLYVGVRYAIHLIDMNMVGIWENRSIYVYYAELVFDLSALSIDFAHHVHMLLWGNIFLSMASLVICMQLRYLFYEFQRRIRRHKNYLRVVSNVEARFPMATKEELDINGDDCAICWERMDTARKVPCGHLFHNSCLRLWLEQDTSCPTCRMSLNERQANPNDPNGNVNPHADRIPNVGGGIIVPNIPPVIPGVVPPGVPPRNQGTTNHFFHFDGSRFASWLPSFSVEVTHHQLAPGRQEAIQTSQLDNMARQVLTVFPHMHLNIVIEDLRTTRSVDHTIDNILEGRLMNPQNVVPVFSNHSSTDSATTTVTSISVSQTILPTTVSRTTATALQAELNHRAQVSLGATRQSSSEGGQQSVQSNISVEQGAVGGVEVKRRTPMPSVAGSRFSKSSLEREAILQHRKNSLLEQARRRYMDKSKLDTDVLLPLSLISRTPEQGADSSNHHQQSPVLDNDPHEMLLESITSSHVRGRFDNPEARRELAYRAAAQRRLQQD